MIKYIILIALLLLSTTTHVYADVGNPYVYDSRTQIQLAGTRLGVYPQIRGIFAGRSGDLRVCVHPVSGVTLSNMDIAANSSDYPTVDFRLNSLHYNDRFYTGNETLSFGSNFVCAHQRWEKIPGTGIPREVWLDADNSCQPQCGVDYLFYIVDLRPGAITLTNACVYYRVRAMDDAFPSHSVERSFGSAQFPICF